MGASRSTDRPLAFRTAPERHPIGPREHRPYTFPAMRIFDRFFDSNDRELRRIQPYVDRANELRPRTVL